MDGKKRKLLIFDLLLMAVLVAVLFLVGKGKNYHDLG